MLPRVPVLLAVALAGAAVLPVTAAGAAPVTGLGVSSDFDGDGWADLAVAVTGEDPGGIQDAGAVQVLFGSASGVSTKGAQYVSDAWAGGTPEVGDSFGTALGAADFDGDGFADLVVGSPFETLENPEGTRSHGTAVVIYGSAAGLSARTQTFTQDTPGLEDTAEGGDEFGAAFGMGDFDGDGFADLAIGSRGEELAEGTEGAGAVHVLYGSAAGLLGVGSVLFSQDTPGIEDVAEPLDRFGVALEGADFDGDGFGDLAVGVHGEDLGVPGSGIGDAGAVAVLYGSAAGISPAGSALFTQDTPGVPGEADDDSALFGTDLAVGDFDGDGFADLAVSAFAEDLHNALDAGELDVLYGSAQGLSGAGAQRWTQNTPGVRGVARQFDTFGVSVAAGDVNGDGFDDLAAGVPGESPGELASAGGVAVLFGSAAGLTAEGDRLITQDTAGIEETAEESDFFGTVVAIAELGRLGGADLAVGSRESLPKAQGAGAVSVLYGSAAGPSANGDQVFTEATKGIRGVPRPFDFFGIALAAA
jgi:hypothetical protein